MIFVSETEHAKICAELVRDLIDAPLRGDEKMWALCQLVMAHAEHLRTLTYWEIMAWVRKHPERPTHRADWRAVWAAVEDIGIDVRALRGAEQAKQPRQLRLRLLP